MRGLAYTQDGTLLAVAAADLQIDLYRSADPASPYVLLRSFVCAVPAAALEWHSDAVAGAVAALSPERPGYLLAVLPDPPAATAAGVSPRRALVSEWWRVQPVLDASAVVDLVAEACPPPPQNPT